MVPFLFALGEAVFETAVVIVVGTAVEMSRKDEEDK